MAGAPSACAPTPCPPGQALDSRTRVLAAHAPSVCRPSPNHFALLTPFPHSSCLLLFLAKEKWTSASGSAVCSVTMDAMRREPALRHGLACRGGGSPHSSLAPVWTQLCATGDSMQERRRVDACPVGTAAALVPSGVGGPARLPLGPRCSRLSPRGAHRCVGLTSAASALQWSLIKAPEALPRPGVVFASGLTVP